MRIQHYCAVCERPVILKRFVLCGDCYSAYDASESWVADLIKTEVRRRRAAWRARADEVALLSNVNDAELQRAIKVA